MNECCTVCRKELNYKTGVTLDGKPYCKRCQKVETDARDKRAKWDAAVKEMRSNGH